MFSEVSNDADEAVHRCTHCGGFPDLTYRLRKGVQSLMHLSISSYNNTAQGQHQIFLNLGSP
jgi:hypothetical protein